MAKNKRKKTKYVLLALIIAVGVFFWSVSDVFVEYFSNTPYGGKTVSITVDMGDTINDIARKLKSVGVIENETGFIYKYKLNREDYGQIQYFEEPFLINNGDTNDEILKRLTAVKPKDMVKVTVPEGFSVDMIALRMQNNGLCTTDEFINAVKNVQNYDFEFIKHIPDGNYKYKLEGFLFPSTYEFERGVSAEKIVEKMLKKFSEEYLAVCSSYDNLFRNITVASLVEREAALDSERGMISGVIYNRLKIDMPLQIDASAVFAASNGMYDITNVNGETVKVDSVYNTYLYKGLPPGPICSPGIKSVACAIEPETHNYLYYHTDTVKNDGSHIFTETYEQHNATMN